MEAKTIVELLYKLIKYFATYMIPCISLYLSYKSFNMSKKLQINQFRFDNAEKVATDKKELYIKVLNEVSKLFNKRLVFDKGFYDKLAEFKGQMSLLGSKEVSDKYFDLLNCLKCRIQDFEAFKRENDPTNNYITIYNEEAGESYDQFNLNDNWETDFNLIIQQYEDNIINNDTEITEKANALVLSMKKDIDLEEFINTL